MTTLLEEYTTEEQRSGVRFFLWAKGLNAKDNRKEMFPVWGGKCLSRKLVHKCVEKFSQGRSKVAYYARPSGGSGRDNRKKTSMPRVSKHR
jgi:hypothetical protein